MSSKSLLRSSSSSSSSSSNNNNNNNNSSSTSSIHSSRLHLKVAPATTTMTMEKNTPSLLFASFSCKVRCNTKKKRQLRRVRKE